MSKPRNPDARTDVARSIPDHILLGFASATLPPQSVVVRDDFVRLALGLFCHKRGYDRLSVVVLASDYDTLRSILLALTNGDLANEDGHYNRALKETSRGGASENETFVRLADICSDVLSWETDGADEYAAEFSEHVAPAWPVLCDEIEFEQENVLYRAATTEDWYPRDDGYEAASHGYSTNAAKRLGRHDWRRYGRT